MKYKGLELKELDGRNPRVFYPPKTMLCRDDDEWRKPAVVYMGLGK